MASTFDSGNSTLTFNARAEHHFAYPEYEGDASFSSCCEIKVRQSQSKAERTDYGLGFNALLSNQVRVGVHAWKSPAKSKALFPSLRLTILQPASLTAPRLRYRKLTPTDNN